jgi:hypothetical protein
MLCLQLLATTANAENQLVDPTRPFGWNTATAQADTGANDAPASKLVLQGIFSTAGARSAMINGRRVQAGDRVEDFQVVAIDRDRVSLVVNGETIQLQTGVAPIKHRVMPDREVAASLPLNGEGRP